MSVPGIRTRYGETLPTRTRPRSGVRSRVLPRWCDDRGQAAIEFTGMIPIILGTLALLWQAALVGYTFSLAGNAADEAARAQAVGASCAAAGGAELPAAWTAEFSCGSDGDLVTADVSIDIPVMFPGFDIPVDLTGHASAVKEN